MILLNSLLKLPSWFSILILYRKILETISPIGISNHFMRARPIISSNESLQLLLQSGSLWLGEKTTAGEGLNQNSLAHTAAPFLIPQIDLALDGGLSFGQIHEWRSNFFEKTAQVKTLIPPHLILCSVFRNILKHGEASNNKKAIIWIGKECWPSVHLLNQLCQNLDWDWQKQVLLIDPQSKQERLSAFRSCLGSKGVLATIGDASSFNLIATRQLQFAARSGGGIGILLRREKTTGLPAYTKWSVEPSQSTQPSSALKGVRALSSIVSWNLSLLKAPGLATIQTWEIELEKTELLLKQKEQSLELPETRRGYGS